MGGVVTLRHAAYAAAAFLLVLFGAAWLDPTQAASNGCATVRTGTPTTCPEPNPPMTQPTTETTVPSSTSEPAATTMPPRPPAVDPTPDPEPRDDTVIIPPLVVDAAPAAAVEGTPETVG